MLPQPALISIDAPHAVEPAQVVAALSTSSHTGLSEAEAHWRLTQYGPNTIAAKPPAPAIGLLVHQLASPVVYLLAAAAVLSLMFGEWEEAAAILAVLAVNTLIGFVTEVRATRSIEALRALGSRSARVKRGGGTKIVPAADLVPGDLVLLDAGDAISADLRLIEASTLAADESTLTGESVPVDKATPSVAADASLSDRTSMLFKGTSVTRGSGAGVVTGTGLDTEIGRITALVETAAPESSPLEMRLARLSNQMAWLVASLTVTIAAIGLVTGKDALLMAEAAIALAVAAIPEGLPIVATLSLARGMWRMARRNVLIERLSAVETLGATTLILTDKTGTLTENRMAVRRLWPPAGEVKLADHAGAIGEAEERLLQIAVLCNNATLGPSEVEDSGDPMELALLRGGRSAGLDRDALAVTLPLARKHAFDAGTKMMATVHRSGERYLYAVKGAPEAVLAVCSREMAPAGAHPLDASMCDVWRARIGDLGRAGLRVLACAEKASRDADDDPYAGLDFLGLIGLEDPTRADVPAAIAACRAAGIRVVMATGDHAVTAHSVGRAVGLADEDGAIVEVSTLADLGDDRANLLARSNIFARVSPADKLDLVRAFQGAGEVVAMTGDGINDAPALRQADIGIAMGRRGTDVARQAAAMVLTDDAFSSIVAAVREGRVIFANIRRFSVYLLGCNLSEVMIVGLAVLTTLPLPILPLQILYLNLVTDVFPAFALAMGEGDKDVLNHPPRDPREPILGRPQWVLIVLSGATMTVGTFASLAASALWLGLDDKRVVTVTFLTLAFAQLWHVFNMRASGSRLFHNDVAGNRFVWLALALCTLMLVLPAYVPPIGSILAIEPPDIGMWSVILTMSVTPMVLVQAAMLFVEHRFKWKRQ